MATVNAIRIKNIVSFAHGSDTYKGIRSVQIQVNKGNVVPVLNEGLQYATSAENLGTDQFPVTGSVEFESAAIMMTLLAAAKGTTVIVGKADGSNADQTFTISNNQFNQASQNQVLQQFGRLTLQFAAHSADGAALPLAITSA